MEPRQMTILPDSPASVNPTADFEAEPAPTDADRDWAAHELNANATDYDVIEADELDWPGTPEEFNRWLDSIAPTTEELEHLARCEAFLGHDD
jgi:hypothetical protein